MIGRKLSAVKSPFADALNELEVGESKVVPLLGRRRVKCHKSEFLDRGFPRHFILMEELTEELRQSEKAAYEKLIRMMSHEVNNSVGAVNSLLHSSLHYKEQLREEDRNDFETAINVVIGRIGQLNSFMKSFADVVRLPAPKLQPCDVTELLEGISLLMRPECERRGITWRWNIQEPLGSIPMDKIQMEQVFLNIVRNAVEAIGRDGAVTINIGRKEGRGFVVIQDTGCGITLDVRANLFTPFFSTKENGQGIGLTMVQEILSEHHFDFSLVGEPGQGTEFAIYF